jgi:ComF family protein
MTGGVEAGLAVRSALDAILSVVLAAPCAACDRPLEAPTRGPVCSDCWDLVALVTPPFCDRCGEPLASWRVATCERGRCPRCRRGPQVIDHARTAGLYEGALGRIIRAFKYGGRRTLARRLAALMRSAGEDLFIGDPVLVPVPLHPRRLRARGFNQASDLAKHLGPPVSPVLRRIRHTPSQTDLPAARRHRNVRGAFAMCDSAWRRRGDVHDRTVLLVDDVTTTGATLAACARVLKDAGAREVCALTAARAPFEPRSRSLLPRPQWIDRHPP